LIVDLLDNFIGTPRYQGQTRYFRVIGGRNIQ